MPDLVFNLVESVAGSGRLIHLAPAALEEVGVPYTGASLSALFLTSNKLAAKRLLSLAGLPTPPWQEGDQPQGGSWSGPWIVKSVWEHASIGMDDGAVVRTLAAAAQRVHGSPDWFAEAYIEGREINLALLGGADGPLVLPAAEIRFDRYPRGKPQIVGYAAKWDQGSFEYRHTPRVFLDPKREDALLARLHQLALACWGLFGLQGYARVDFRLDEAGRPWVLEVNANPCLSPDAGLAAAAARAGIPYPELVGRIAAGGLRRAGPAPSAR
jgi:D-alanine-D-alanine ligase